MKIEVVEVGGTPDGYLMDAETHDRLCVVLTRLYDERPLSGDQRRDLANMMDALLHRLEPCIIHDV